MAIEKVTIIGAGPAGLSTALQLKRHGIDARVLERDSIGGVLRNANRVENYPGFPAGITGPELVGLFEKQAGRAGVAVTHDEVCSIDFDDGVFVIDGRHDKYLSRVVVIASGTKPRMLDGLDLRETVRDRVFYEVYPLLGVSGKKIAIIGAGDAAFDYALNLAGQNSVVILNRGSGLKCLRLLWDRAGAAPGIEYLADAAVTGVAEGGSRGLRLSCDGPAGKMIIDADYLIGAIGRNPDLDFISKNFQDRIAQLTEKALLYFAGDVRHGRLRQTAIAVGDGILTAMTIHHGREEPSR